MDAKTTSFWYRRPGVIAATAAMAAGVSIAVIGPSDRDSVNFDASAPHATWSMGYILVTADPWAPDPQTAAPPPPPPPAAPPAPAAPAYEAPARQYAPQYVPPPAPPPPPPPQLNIRLDNPITAAFVSMANNPPGSTVGCHMNTVATSGTAAAVGWAADNDFSLTGGQEARVPAGSSNGPATGSSFHITVNCDNGTSTSMDAVY
ncbi:hypothetical protein [Mycobacterium sp. HM-7]